MGKRTTFTNITPLPPSVTREVAIAMLHNHDEMIELNPLVIEHHPIKTPRDAPADEFLDCAWQELTDKIHYLPGGVAKGKVTYRACFHDLPNGLQTHIYAPLGLDIREKWSICGTLPGEPEEARELGLDTPRQGLYLKEEGDMRCNVLMTGFVRKNLDNSHKVLVERILGKASRVQTYVNNPQSATTPVRQDSILSPSQPNFQAGSHMSKSSFTKLPGAAGSIQSQTSSGQQSTNDQSFHPALRDSNQQYPDQNSAPPAYEARTMQQGQMYHQDMAKQAGNKQFSAEMEGSTDHYYSGASSTTSSARAPLGQSQNSNPIELAGSETYNTSPTSNTNSQAGSRSFVSELPSGYEEQHSQSLLPSQAKQKQERVRRSFDEGDDGAVPESYVVAPLRPHPAQPQAPDRFSVISGVSDMPTPKLNAGGFEDNRFSVVSAMTEAPTPKPQQTTFDRSYANDGQRRNDY